MYEKLRDTRDLRQGAFCSWRRVETRPIALTKHAGTKRHDEERGLREFATLSRSDVSASASLRGFRVHFRGPLERKQTSNLALQMAADREARETLLLTRTEPGYSYLSRRHSDDDLSRMILVFFFCPFPRFYQTVALSVPRCLDRHLTAEATHQHNKTNSCTPPCDLQC